MSKKLSLREKLLASQAKAREVKEQKSEIKSDQPKLEPTVSIPEEFRVGNIENRLQNQNKSRKINPKQIIISNPQLPPSKINEPRLLTSEELDYLLEGIPIPMRIRSELLKPLLQQNPNRPRMNYSSDPDISYLIYTQMLKYQRFLLSEVKLTPSALSDFRNYMTVNFIAARSVPGTSVGIQCGDAVSAPITQSTLNSFHSSGTSKSISYGISYLEELINASKDRKQTYNSIHFKNKFMGFERVLEYRRKLVEINVGNLITDYDILPYTELSMSYWYADYLKIYETEVSAWGLRLYLNPQLMFDYRITIAELRNSLIREQPTLINLVISPLHENIIDIYPVESQIGGAFESRFKNQEIEATPVIFLQNLLLPLLSKMKIKGIERITNLFPVNVPVWAGIKTVQKISPNIWNCIYDPKILKINKLDANRIKSLLTYLNFIILEEYDNRIVIKMPTDYVGKELNPNEYILGKIDAEKEHLEDEYEKNLIYPYSELLNLAQYWIAETNGSNLEALYAIRELDHDIITTNDIHEAKAVFGIEGAKHVLLKEFLDALDSLGSGTDPKHIILMTDFMTNKGEYLGFTKTGVAEQETSAYEQAAFERANETLFNAAVFGERLPVSSVTTSVFIGAEGNFGTNYNRVITTPTVKKQYEEKVQGISKLSVSEAESALNYAFDDPDAFTFANPTLEFGGNAKVDFDPSIRRILTDKANENLNRPAPFINPSAFTIGLPPNRSNPTPNFTIPTIGLPTTYKGKVEQEVKNNTAPIRSELLTNSVAKISGVPRLDNPQPIHIPISIDNFYENDLPIQIKTSNVKKEVNEEIKEEIKANTIAIPKPAGFDITPISGITSSGISGIPKLQIKGIPPLKGIPSLKGIPIGIGLPSGTK